MGLSNHAVPPTLQVLALMLQLMGSRRAVSDRFYRWVWQSALHVANLWRTCGELVPPLTLLQSVCIHHSCTSFQRLLACVSAERCTLCCCRQTSVVPTRRRCLSPSSSRRGCATQSAADALSGCLLQDPTAPLLI